MAGDIFAKEGSIVTITSSGASAATGTATSAGTADMRSGGTANLIEPFIIAAEWTVQWSTITGLTVGVLLGDLFLVPSLDGTNAADIDTTSGSSFIAPAYYVDSFYAHKTLVTATNYRFVTSVQGIPVYPGFYTAYIFNRSGQTTTANWTLKIGAARSQYT